MEVPTITILDVLQLTSAELYITTGTKMITIQRVCIQSDSNHLFYLICHHRLHDDKSMYFPLNTRL